MSGGSFSAQAFDATRDGMQAHIAELTAKAERDHAEYARRVIEAREDAVQAWTERNDLADRLERVQALADAPPLVHDGQPVVRLDDLCAALDDTGGEDQ